MSVLSDVLEELSGTEAYVLEELSGTEAYVLEELSGTEAYVLEELSGTEAYVLEELSGTEAYEKVKRAADFVVGSFLDQNDCLTPFPQYTPATPADVCPF